VVTSSRVGRGAEGVSIGGGGAASGCGGAAAVATAGLEDGATATVAAGGREAVGNGAAARFAGDDVTADGAVATVSPYSTARTCDIGIVCVMLSSPAILISPPVFESTIPLMVVPSRSCTLACGPLVGVLLQALTANTRARAAAIFMRPPIKGFSLW